MAQRPHLPGVIFHWRNTAHYTKDHAVYFMGNANKSGLSKKEASEKIIEAMNQCWGKQYPEDTRYFINHLDSYISGQENLEPQIDAWLKANPD
jgi:hypothetical protein